MHDENGFSCKIRTTSYTEKTPKNKITIASMRLSIDMLSCIKNVTLVWFYETQ